MTIETEGLINNRFIEHISDFKDYLLILKNEVNKFENIFSDEIKRNNFLKNKRNKVCKKLDFHFDIIWDDFRSLTKEEFRYYKEYYVKELMPYLGEGIETNTYIRNKPLGYAGDYVTMNYIYDYHDGKYLGNTLYSKLINFYTCNINVACSNIFRKEFLKKKILEHVNIQKHNPQILSVGCGPAREITELLKDKRISNPVTIHLLDLEKKAIDFIKKEIDKINYDTNIINLYYYKMDLIEIVKNKKIAAIFNNIDLVYVSGVFDYLSDRLCARVAKGMFEITKKELIIFNMSLENAQHRAYYEVFGEWVMCHRKKDEILNWTKNLDGYKKISIQNYSDCKSYWILEVEK